MAKKNKHNRQVPLGHKTENYLIKFLYRKFSYVGHKTIVHKEKLINWATLKLYQKHHRVKRQVDENI